MLRTDIPHESTVAKAHLGTAGWTVRREHAPRFPAEGTHLSRYASLLNAVEINSCFHRPHRFVTYERWAASVPENFRFAVKLSKVITHKARLIGAVPELERFLSETSGLGSKLGPILVQLPPKLAYDEAVATAFFTELRERFSGDVVFEPRHETWFTDDVEAMLIEHKVARVGTDPARVPAAALPGGYDRIVYLRLHGSPRMYYSAYPAEWLESLSRTIAERTALGISTWCIFDNTTLGAATTDALTVKSHLLDGERVP